MIAIPAPNAPEKTSSIIGNYSGRWIFISLPTLLFLGAALSMLMIPFGDGTTTRTRVLWAGGFALAWLVWMHFTFIVPLRKYNTLVASGYIIEIRDPAILAFNKKYWNQLERSVNDARAAESQRHSRLLRDMWVHSRAKETEELRALIDAEEERVAKLRLTD